MRKIRRVAAVNMKAKTVGAVVAFGATALILYAIEYGVPFVEGTTTVESGEAFGFRIGMSKSQCVEVIDAQYRNGQFSVVGWSESDRTSDPAGWKRVTKRIPIDGSRAWVQSMSGTGMWQVVFPGRASVDAVPQVRHGPAGADQSFAMAGRAVRREHLLALAGPSNELIRIGRRCPTNEAP
ncbi:MAG: hypothetical protein KBD01_15395 [Acidobacteria bacterium]|nr:hypothetical protein [Acidobacteriota bacterium]